MFWQRHHIEKKDLLIPASILIGAILVSISILWSAGKFADFGIKSLGTGGSDIPDQKGETLKVVVGSRKDAPTAGSGKVEIIEFSDFQCPFCQQFYNSAYKEIKTKYIDTGKVKFTYRHLPLPFHQNAQKSAEASECANRQGKFWQYHDTLFMNSKADGGGLNTSDLKRYAIDLGLNADKFNACLDNGETAEAVKKDIEEAGKAGASGTPTFVIDGVRVVGAQPFSEFEKTIEAALKAN